ncbi:dihydrolipoamide acetyltransferase family protein [Pedomonas mirosovicensis]|uniref:dihydrolipoamide acetyltransferase family protein n=1 Tax=Pedomonas mirosovicensis TaxID=2908641 RepID=UPI00216712F0|nr:2-oxo acid dehydrogenase subunit E2 [Pedomonas mirosovicensis]MCH8685709.1 2-oxo acid dehydrogenase subunit E2 [Pedomonas mirosovicensis]
MSGTSIEILAPSDQPEGTRMALIRWLKSVGDPVAEDEPIAELETDKVTLEVNAPASGVLAEVSMHAGETVASGQRLGLIRIARVEAHSGEDSGATDLPTAAADDASRTGSAAAQPVQPNGHEHRLSPSVRRLLLQHELNPALISGTGRGGRITREDVLAYLDRQAEPQPAPTQARPQAAPAPAPSQPGASTLIPHDGMRRSIAEHMVRSVSTAPHVTALFEMDLTRVLADRKARRAEFQAQGADLTLTAYFIAASVAAMRAVPQVNSRFHEHGLEVFSDINIGIGTALEDKGLIVPVVHKAQELSLFGIARRLEDIKNRARVGALKPADVQGGTFTISNHGTSGSLLAAPIIINQPQSAILGIGKLEKRVVVREIDGSDAMVIRPMAYVSLTIDHRVLDGFQTNAWLSAFVSHLENWAG